MHRLRLFELHSHKFLIFIEEVEGSFAVRVEGNINIFKSISTGFIGWVKVNVSIIVLDKSICPRLKKSLLSYQTLLVDWNLFIEKCLNYRCEDDFESFRVDVFEVFDLELILHGESLYFLSRLPIDDFGDVVKFPPNFLR